MTSVDLQLSPANTDWPTLRRAAREADDRGYGVLWVLDHLAGVAVDGVTMLEAFALLGALADATDSIELGTMVANVWNREPGTLVSAIASVGVIADRQVHLGVGAGAAPGTRWATEQTAVGAVLESDVSRRHQRVVDVLDLADRQWRHDRDERFATFPLPRRRPTTVVGVNSVALSRLAGERADGINVLWRHPRRDEFVHAARSAAAGRPLSVTTYAVFDPALLDADHPERRTMAALGVDRVVLAVFDDLRGWLADEVAPT